MYYLCLEKESTPLFSSAGKFLSEGGAIHPRRRLDTAVLLLGCKGEYPIGIEKREYILSKGCCQLLFPEIEHYGTKPSKGTHSHFWCHFHLPCGYFIINEDELSLYSDEKYIILPEFFKIDDYEKQFVIFNQMIDESENRTENGYTSEQICSCYIKILLLHLDVARRKSGIIRDSTSKRAAISKIKEYLRYEACNGTTAAEAAEQLCYNPDHLNRLIKSETGMTLTSYLNSIRITRAKNLLQNSSMKICDIAENCGFSDDKYFMRVFKKHESITPTKYREVYFRVHINH